MSKERVPQDFNAVTLKLASPERIREWSYGEVTKAETVNYRTQRSERKGLFDEAIFGPEKDYECYCGKYRRIRYKDIICEKCGVEVTRSIVRRERMGHIELASPVAHIWFFRSIPSRIATLLGTTMNDLEKVIYFSGYIVTSVNDEEKAKVYKELDSEYKSKLGSLKGDEAKDKLKQSLNSAKAELASIAPWKVLDEVNYHKYSLKYGHIFEAEIGAEAIYNIFRDLDIEKFYKETKETYEKANSTDKAKIVKRLDLLKGLRRSGVRPEHMFLRVVPVIPPALRPMVALQGGRSATSDINDLYRRVINRNNRLKKLLEIKAPDVILRNEKRILQEAVDALIDNSFQKATGAMSQAQRRPLKSLSENLKGKSGRFRQNLLGKRVDYSARSVIVVGPELSIDQCGLPKHMALELFKPFVISKLLERELAFNIRGASKLIEEGSPEVWEILEEVSKNKRVLLNRAPTLHRLGIQAFKPVLIEGNAIKVHPLVCSAYNADFDGDQMAVHLPLSIAAQDEARDLMDASHNMLSPGKNEVITRPAQDIILGVYWMTKIMPNDKKTEDLKYFGSPNEAIAAYDHRNIKIRDEVMVRPTETEKYEIFEGKMFRTTVGRLMFNSVLPSDFPYINETQTQKGMTGLLDKLVIKYGLSGLPNILDNIKKFGFRYSRMSGISWGIDEVHVPEGKTAIVNKAWEKIHEIESQFAEGFISNDELYRKKIEIWQDAKNSVEKILVLDPNSSAANMIDSGARGKMVNVSQMAGMRGLSVSPSGRIIEHPVVPSFKEGLSPLEYFATTHGARKGLADTALNTARAGYLTRKLVYVADNAIIREDDCGDTEGRVISRDNAHVLSKFGDDVRGRYIMDDIRDEDGKIVFKKGYLIYKQDAAKIEAMSHIRGVKVRTPLACKAKFGLCGICYGLDMAHNRPVRIGEAVGIVAAQAIGEPGTQLTMRTFHSGGVATDAGDIVGALPRVEELFNRRMPKVPAIIAEHNGDVADIRSEGNVQIIEILIEPGSGKTKKQEKIMYEVPIGRVIKVKVGESVKKGQVLTAGPVDITKLYKFAGRMVAENYIIEETHDLYSAHGSPVSRKHLEVIVTQMFSRKKIVTPGDTVFSVGEIVDAHTLEEENERIERNGEEKAKVSEIVLGITEVNMTKSSFLASAAFENTQRLLTKTALRGGVDRLRGLKENIIIGRLIPAGTGMIERAKQNAQSVKVKKEGEDQ